LCDGGCKFLGERRRGRGRRPKGEQERGRGGCKNQKREEGVG
jgi:hypothetical protein